MYLSTSFQWHGANRFLGTKKSPLQAFEAVSSRSSRLITASPIAILRTRPWRWLSLSLDLRRDPADRHVLKHVDALIDHGMLTSEPKLCRHVNQAITRTARIRHHDPLSQGHQLSGSVLPRERFRSLTLSGLSSLGHLATAPPRWWTADHRDRSMHEQRQACLGAKQRHGRYPYSVRP